MARRRTDRESLVKRLKVRVHPGDVYVTENGRFSATTFNASYGMGHKSANLDLVEFLDGTMCTVIAVIERMNRKTDSRLEQWCMFLVDNCVCYRYVDPLNENDHGLRRVVTM